MASALLANSEFADESSSELVNVVSAFRSLGEKYVADGSSFDQARHDLFSYMIATGHAAAWLSAGTGAHAPTDFLLRLEELQRDPRLEGLAGHMAVRIRILNGDAEQLLTMIDSATSLAERD